MSGHAGEPLRALPGPLPAGERLIWQGAPCWVGLARHALHVGKLAAYFAGLLLWYVGASLAGGEALGATTLSALKLAALATGALGVLVLIAWLAARSTVYTITSRRIVLRIGVALPMSVNLPFAIVGAAALRLYPDGTGDIPLRLTGDGRLGFIHLWPHARPWRLARPEPMLRSVPDAARVAEILAQALTGAAGTQPAQSAAGKVVATARKPRPLMGAAA